MSIENLLPLRAEENRVSWGMIGLLGFVLAILVSPFRSKARLQAENTLLPQQLIVCCRKRPGRVGLTNGDWLFFIQLYRRFPSVLQLLPIIRPETLARWHQAGFRRRNVKPGPLIGADQ